MATVPAGIYDLVVDASATRWKTNPSAMIWGRAPRTGPEPNEVEDGASTSTTFLSNVKLPGYLLLLTIDFMFCRHAAYDNYTNAGQDSHANPTQDEEKPEITEAL